MENIKTLEQRLHAEAEKELKDEIKKALEKVNWLASPGGVLRFPAEKIRTRQTKGADVVDVDMRLAINMLEATLFHDNVDRRRQNAVDNFLGEVAELRERLNGLEESVDRERE